MLQLSPEQAEALERVEQALLQRRLARHLAVQWPATAERLGERLPTFIEFTLAAAQRHGLRIALAALRYVNLCFVWGSGFEDKPGFEWARALLAEPKAHEWQKAHQLLRRSIERLARRGGGDGLPTADALTQADTRLLQVFAGIGVMGRLLLREGIELPLQPCDLELAAIRVTQAAGAFDYELTPAGINRVPTATAAAPAAPTLRIDTANPVWPQRLNVMARAVATGAQPARLQLRTQPHACCDAAWHPHVAFAGNHGLWEWRGAETRAISWPLKPPATQPPATSFPVAIAEQVPPEISRLQFDSCALREQGVPLGSGSLQVWTYAATQWLFQLSRSAPEMMHWPQQNHAAGVNQIRLECDGDRLEASAWLQGFETLDAQMHQGLARLGSAWERSLGLEKAQLSASAGLLCGQAALAWGWRQRAPDLTAPVAMRLQAQLDLQALALDLRCAGELRLSGVHALLRLRASADEGLRMQLDQLQASADQPATPEAQAVPVPPVARFRVPFTLELESLATADAAVVNPLGPCSGALVGEVGLRPRLSGGSGWQWFAELRVEAVAVDISLDDPLLGQTRQTLTLLPALPLLSWSAG